MRLAKKILDEGGIIALPTDTIYGIAVKINNSNGINNIYSIKGRDTSKAIPVLIGDNSHLNQVVKEITPITQLLIDHFWPGALTLIFMRKPGLPVELSQLQTIGIRMPDYKPAIKLINITGPLAVTSANLSGRENSVTHQDVLEQLDGKIDLLLDGGETPGNIPSTVVDCTTNNFKILREGIIPASSIEKIIYDYL